MEEEDFLKKHFTVTTLLTLRYVDIEQHRFMKGKVLLLIPLHHFLFSSR